MPPAAHGAEEAGGAAYWADESAIAVLQRYLGARFLIYNPAGAEGYRCVCSGDVPPSCVPPAGLAYVVLRHSHRASKVQQRHAGHTRAVRLRTSCT